MTKNNRQLLATASFVFLLLLIFRGFLTGNAVLMSTDAAISTAHRTLVQTCAESVSFWDDAVLLGFPRGSAMQVPALLRFIHNGVVWNNLVYGTGCFVAALIFLVVFKRKLSPWASACGALTAFWLGSNFTLIYAGHVLKPYVVLFFIGSVLCAGASSWAGGLLWGGCTGLMFAQQPDVALFFALFAAAYLLFRLWHREGFKPLRWLKVLLPAAVAALLFAAGPLLSGYKLNVKDTAQVQTETPEAKWEYITQWSFPPDELISLVAPGYHGWRSGEPSGPYWGRTGRSAGWELTRQGFMNFMMESAYVGFIPAALALFALFSCRRSPRRAEILFWGGAALVALLLSFGKHTPLYALFYQLPVINNIRNPNKFLQVFQVAWAVLTAYGLDALLRRDERKESAEAEAKDLRRFFWITAAALAALLLGALAATAGQSGSAARFADQGWAAEAAQVIAANQSRALWHAEFMAACTAAVFGLAVFRRPSARMLRAAGGGLVLLVAADALLLSRHYVQPMPRSYIAPNALTAFLKENLGAQRTALLTQQGLYNVWLTYLLPYNRIPSFNFSQMPRMAEDYKKFLEAGSKDPLRMWRFSSVKYLLGPSAFDKQLGGQAKKVFAYNLAAESGNEFRLVPDPNGPHAVFELADALPRYALLAGFAPRSGEQTLAALADRRLPLFGGTLTGAVEVVRSRPARIELKTSADTPVVLRIAERWDPDWKAEVDGRPVAVQKVDWLCQGVELPAGSHAVVLRYAPSKLFFYLQCAGGLLLLIGAVAAWRQKSSPRGN